MQEDMIFLGYLVYRRQHDDFLCRLVLQQDYTLTAWSPQPCRSTIFTRERALYVAKRLEAEICPIYDRGDDYWVLFNHDVAQIEVRKEHKGDRT